VIEKIKDLFDQYANQIMTWYNGLEQLYQYGVIFLLIVFSLLTVAYVLLSRITK